MGMKTSFICGALALGASVAAATSLAPAPLYPLVGAHVIQLEMAIGRNLSSEHDLKRLFHHQDERWRLFTAKMRSELGDRFEAAGIELEPHHTAWYDDRARYENTGVPHYRLEIVISGRHAGDETGGGIDYGFLVEARLEAELLTPEHEAVETFSARRMGFAVETELEAELQSVISTIVEEILDAEIYHRPMDKQSWQLQDGRLSLDLLPPWHGNLLAFYRRELAGISATGELFAEPRRTAAEPLARFKMMGDHPPAQVLITDDRRYLVAIYRRQDYRLGPHLVIYRGGGLPIASGEVRDLLSADDQITWRMSPLSEQSQWGSADHAFDQERDRLILALPVGQFFGGEATDRVARFEIDLATGHLVNPRVDHLPRLEPRATLVGAWPDTGPGSETLSSSLRCWPGRTPDENPPRSARELPLADLIARAASRPMPRYNEIGRKTRITGRVGIEMLVAESGDLICTHLTKKLPMGLSEEALKAVKSWRFSPAPAGSGPAHGHLTFEFDLVVALPRSDADP